jgi:hypothetical protein
MILLNFLKQKGKSELLKVKRKTNTLIVKPAYDQIVDNLKSISESDDNTDYYWVITEMKNHLNYKEVELLVNLTNDLPNWSTFLSALEKEKHYWKEEIRLEYLKDLENAKLSLCTSDYLAFIIGKKYELYLLMNKSSYWKEYYENFDSDFNLLIIQKNVLCGLEGNQKAHVPVSYALSMFLLHDKNTALAKFKRILSTDREHRLEALHQAEYFLITENFFSRIKLDFIPKINFSNQLNPINFKNKDNQYITRDEIKILIDKEDYFNKREFSVDTKKLLTPRNILNRELLMESYIMFFKSIDNKFERKNVDILISCFTENNPKYEEIEIKNARFILNTLLIKHKKNTDFIVLNYYLSQKGVFYESMNNLAFLLDNFFNKVDGMRVDTNKGVFYGKKNVDFDKAFSSDLKDYIKKKHLQNTH